MSKYEYESGTRKPLGTNSGKIVAVLGGYFEKTGHILSSIENPEVFPECDLVHQIPGN